MKKLIFTLCAVMAVVMSSSILAQSPRIITNKNAYRQRTVTPYDSTYNISGRNVQNLVGQSIVFLPDERAEREGDYGVMMIYLEDDDVESPPLTSKNMYYPTDRNISPVTKYSVLEGKVFTIIDYFPPKSLSDEPELILINPDDGRKMSMCNQSFRQLKDLPIIVSGYYEKKKEGEINKFYLLNNGKYVIRISDGAHVNNIPGDVLECVDISFDSIKNVLLILSDQEGTLYSLLQWRASSDLFDVERSDSLGKYDITPSTPRKLSEPFLVKKYGASLAEKILNGDIEIGFDEDMCRAAWGWPNKRNTTKTKYGTSEQWVYDNGYLYFENGILTTIQK